MHNKYSFLCVNLYAYLSDTFSSTLYIACKLVFVVNIEQKTAYNKLINNVNGHLRVDSCRLPVTRWVSLVEQDRFTPP